MLAKLPGFPDAILSLAAADLAAGATDSAQLQITQVLADSRAGQAQKARANGLLGDVLDAAGRYQEAFGAYAACNELLRKLIGALRRYRPARLYRGAGGGDAARRSAQWAAPLRRPTAARTAPAGHVFCSAFRAPAPRCWKWPSTAIRVSSASRSMSCSRPSADVHARAGGLRRRSLRADARELGALRERYWREVREAGLEVAGKVFVDKHPLHSLKLPLIARLFPKAKILFAYRDPRDVVLSCFRRRFNMNPAMYQLLTLEGAAAVLRRHDAAR